MTRSKKSGFMGMGDPTYEGAQHPAQNAQQGVDPQGGNAPPEFVEDFLENERVVIAGKPNDVERVKSRLGQKGQPQPVKASDHLGGGPVAGHCCGSDKSGKTKRPLLSYIKAAFSTKKRAGMSILAALMIYNAGPTVVLGSFSDGGPRAMIEVQRENFYTNADSLHTKLQMGVKQYRSFSDPGVAAAGGKVTAEARQDALKNSGLANILENAADLTEWARDTIGKQPQDWERRTNRPENPLEDMASSFRAAGASATGGQTSADDEETYSNALAPHYYEHFQRGQARADGRQAAQQEESERIRKAEQDLSSSAEKARRAAGTTFHQADKPGQKPR